MRVGRTPNSSREDSPEYEPMHNPYRKLRNYEVVYDKQLPQSTLAMQLSELATKHAQSVPFRVQVATSDMTAKETGPTIAAGSTYTVHLVRDTRVLVAELNSGAKLEIPINSSIKIGLVPEGDAKLCRTMADILGSKQLPKVIAVRHRFLSSDKKISLRKNDVLLVKEAVRGILGHTKTALRVFSLSQHQELVLPKDCSAEFITDPKCTQCYATDLLDNDIAFLPCSAYLYPTAATLPSSRIAISQKGTRKSLIVSNFQDPPNSELHCRVFIDIPTSANVCVTILTTDLSGRIYDRIYEESQHLLTHYNPSQIWYCVTATGTAATAQATLLAEVREGRAMREMVCSAPQQYHKCLTAGLGLETKAYPAVPTVSIDIHM